MAVMTTTSTTSSSSTTLINNNNIFVTSPSPQFKRLTKKRSSLLPPADRVVSEGFIEIVFLLLGVGILLPWNAYISAKHYFVSRLCDSSTTATEATTQKEDIEMWFSIMYNAACVISLAVVIIVQHNHDQKNNNIHRQHENRRHRCQYEVQVIYQYP